MKSFKEFAQARDAVRETIDPEEELNPVLKHKLLQSQTPGLGNNPPAKIILKGKEKGLRPDQYDAHRANTPGLGAPPEKVPMDAQQQLLRQLKKNRHPSP